MSKICVLVKVALCLVCFCICCPLAEAQQKNRKKNSDEPYMHISLESPLWLSNPNTLDNSHKAGFGFRAHFPIKASPWNFLIGFSQYNYGQHVNLIDISDSNTIEGNEGTITFKEGTYLLKYASLPLGLVFDKKFWSASFDIQFLFNINQAEVHNEGFSLHFGTEDFEDFDKDKLNKFNSALTFSFAGKLPLGERWTIYAEPEFQYLMKPVFKGGIDEVRRSNIFLKLGLRHLIQLPDTEAESAR